MQKENSLSLTVVSHHILNIFTVSMYEETVASRILKATITASK